MESKFLELIQTIEDDMQVQCLPVIQVRLSEMDVPEGAQGLIFQEL